MNERELHDAVGRLPKSIEPPRDLWPDIEARIGRASWGRRWYWIPLAAAAVLAGVWLVRSQPASWDVTKLAGRPLVGTTPLAATGRLRVGDWLQTDDSSRALIAVGRIGQVEVRPETRVQLLAATATDHRLALARGTIDAKVDAVPRMFFVETPAGTAIDLGCAYTLQTDSLGRSAARHRRGSGVSDGAAVGARSTWRAHADPADGRSRDSVRRRRAGAADPRVGRVRLRQGGGARYTQRARRRARAGCALTLASAPTRRSGAARPGV